MADFITAAFPWILLGITLSVLFTTVINTTRRIEQAKREGNMELAKQYNQRCAIGLCFGPLLGIVFAKLTGMDIAMGIAMGPMWGMIAAAWLTKPKT